MVTDAVPTFSLYGEPHRAVDLDFVHVEPLDDRSRPGNWTIRPHAHADLNHIFLIASGGGSMEADGRRLAFAPPALLTVPPRLVHGFAWETETRGWVATVAQVELDAITSGDREIAALFATARAIPVGAEGGAAAEARMGALMRELGWSRPGRHAALRSGLLELIVLALRGEPVVPAATPKQGRQAALVARFRDRIGNRFRLREPVGRHAEALGVSESALRSACVAVSGRSPAGLLDERALLEARRALLYSNMSVAEVGWSVGFADPAYFSRFFSRHVRQSPAQYRLSRVTPRSGG